MLRRAGFAPLEALYVVQAAPMGKSVEETARELYQYDPEDELDMGLEALLSGLKPGRKAPRFRR